MRLKCYTIMTALKLCYFAKSQCLASVDKSDCAHRTFPDLQMTMVVEAVAEVVEVMAVAVAVGAMVVVVGTLWGVGAVAGVGHLAGLGTGHVLAVATTALLASRANIR